MNTAALKPLFLLTLRDPREAAGMIVAMRLPSQALWLALSLVSVLTSIIFSALLHAAPMPQDEIGQLLESSPGYNSPLIFAMLQWGRAVLSIFVLYWVGKAFGGLGELVDVLAVMTWLQVVTFVLVGVLFVLGVVLPMLSSLGMLVVFGWWLWAVVCFLDVAHRFESGVKAFFVLLFSIFGVLIGLSLFLGVIGGIVVGTSGVS